MKLRTKVTLFFGSFFLVTAVALVVYVEYVVGNTFNKQISNDFRIIAEQTESAYIAFLESMKTRTIDWTSDTMLRNMAKATVDAPFGTPEHMRSAKEFAAYVNEKKMPYDKTIFLVDLLDKNGIVISSTRLDRIGTNELKEEVDLNAHQFSRAIASSFGEVFVTSFIFEEDEASEPMTHSVTRLFTFGKDGKPEPLEAVLLVHFANTKQVAHSIGINVDLDNTQTAPMGSRISRMALLESYKTSDIYLVNSDRTMVTPSRYVQDVSLHQKVGTLPVRECLENGKEISEEYDNYQGSRVFGASMCFKDDALVLVVEIEKDEISAPLYVLIRMVFAGGLAILVFSILVAIFFVRKSIARIGDVVAVAKRVEEGNLDAQVTVRSKDEIGYLASSFNKMVVSIRDARNALNVSKREVEEKAEVLEKDVLEHEKQQKFLEESKKATMNLLEDMMQTKEKLEMEEYRLQTILSSIGDGLILIDGQYKVALMNPKAEEFLGFTDKELLGKDLRSVVKLFKKKKEELSPSIWPTEEMFLKRSIVSVGLEAELSLMTERREVHLPIALSVSPLGGGLAGAVIVIRDVTEDRELDDAKSGFISVASHQLRTPLTTIRWYSEMLLSEDVGTLSPAQQDFLKEVHSGAERLYQTIDLLLGISRIESGKIKMEKVAIDLAIFTDDIVKELRPSIDEKKLAVTVTPLPVPVSVSLDPLTLRQVVLNLVSNAIRYTNDGGNIEIRWKIGDDSKDVVYEVRDNGIGIPRSQQKRIFTKFFRAENALVKVPDGSGLGLALVKQLTESWGGRVWFETEEGKGTTFYFTIPLQN